MQKNDVMNRIIREYAGKTPITVSGIDLLYNRAESRGYQPEMIYAGLRTMICKNYMRSEYEPPHKDPAQEAIHDRLYIEDWEFRDIMNGYITT